MSKFSVNTKITVPGTIVEIIENEAKGIRYKVKFKSNDSLQYLWFEEDEINGGSTPDPTPETAPETDPETNEETP
jgi:hypothetical protein